MTASIQVGVVDGIDMAVESVPTPDGALPYDAADLPAIGNARGTTFAALLASHLH